MEKNNKENLKTDFSIDLEDAFFIKEMPFVTAAIQQGNTGGGTY